MRTSAHTPGPWVLIKGKCGKDVELTIRDANLYLLFSDTQYYPCVSSNEADWHLLAAAPDLLTTLVELLAMCERQDDFNDDGDGGMFERAHAAISKATGVAP